MIGKFAALLIIGFTFFACSNRFKHSNDFSFLRNNVVSLDTSLIGESGGRTHVGNLDSCFTWFGVLSTTYNLGYKLGFCSDSFFIYHGQDTVFLQDMLGPDSVHVDWFNFQNFYNVEIYRLYNRLSGERHLYLSWGHQNMGSAPGSKINFVFPLSKNDHIEGVYAYVTNSSDAETDPCLDCFTDYNRDGKTDFIRWIYGGENAPVEYLNFSKNGQRTYHRTPFKSIYMYQGMSWGIVHKGYLGNRNR